MMLMIKKFSTAIGLPDEAVSVLYLLIGLMNIGEVCIWRFQNKCPIEFYQIN